MFYGFFSANYLASTLLVLAAVVFAAAMSAKVRTTFTKFSKIPSKSGLQAHEAARQILDSYALYDVSVVRVSGELTDHYDIRNKTLALSDSTYFSSSVAAIGVAAHECGHAVQYAKGYFPIKLRNLFAPVVQFSSSAWLLIFLMGLLFSVPFLVDIGIILFGAIVLFQLLTLPVEFNASKRALEVIESQRLLYDDEIDGARKTLNAAALTYVAGLAVSLSQLIRLILSSNKRR